jgi:hypothetical protein
MSGLSRVLRKGAVGVALLPAFALAGSVMGSLLLNRFRSEDPAAPSGSVTVVGVWEVDGEALCRAFDYEELLPDLDSLHVRFVLDEDDGAMCRSAFATYDAEAGWPRKLRPNERDYLGFRFEMDRREPDLVVTITRFHGDAVSATTRYRVGEDGAISDVQTKGTGPGSGLAFVLGAMGGAAAWVVWVLWSLFAGWWRRTA